MADRVTFLIDGFNLYHSIRDALDQQLIKTGKWLDIRALSASFLSVFGKDALLEEVYYFSALAHHASDPRAPMRHQIFIEALQSTGVKPILGNFKRKKVKCRAQCKLEGWGYEEKETDINIAVTLLELLMKDQCDTVVIVSGDTDLSTAIRAAKRLFPQKRVGVGFPYKRANAELKQLADPNCTFRLKPHHYEKFALSDPVVLPDGKTLRKPTNW